MDFKTVLKETAKTITSNPDKAREIIKECIAELNKMLVETEPSHITLKMCLAPPGQFQGHINMMRDQFKNKEVLTKKDILELPVVDAIYILEQITGIKAKDTDLNKRLNNLLVEFYDKGVK